MVDGGNGSARLQASEIYDRVTDAAREEITRRSRNLAISALAAGLTMALSAVGVAAVMAAFGASPAAEIVAAAVYPIGFIAVIIGRQQLFTENTLFPVALVLETRRFIAPTLRLWLVVLVANLVGTSLAAAATRTAVLSPDVVAQLVQIGHHEATRGAAATFWSATAGGWLVALVAWLVTGSDSTAAQIAVIWFLTFVIALAELSHSIAGSVEVLTAAIQGEIGASSYLTWLAAAVAGNVAGGVGLVTLLNYGQTLGE